MTYVQLQLVYEGRTPDQVGEALDRDIALARQHVGDISGWIINRADKGRGTPPTPFQAPPIDYEPIVSARLSALDEPKHLYCGIYESGQMIRADAMYSAASWLSTLEWWHESVGIDGVILDAASEPGALTAETIDAMNRGNPNWENPIALSNVGADPFENLVLPLKHLLANFGIEKVWTEAIADDKRYAMDHIGSYCTSRWMLRSEENFLKLVRAGQMAKCYSTPKPVVVMWAKHAEHFDRILAQNVVPAVLAYQLADNQSGHEALRELVR